MQIFIIVNHDHTGFISCHNLEQLASAGTYNFIPNGLISGEHEFITNDTALILETEIGIIEP